MGIRRARQSSPSLLVFRSGVTDFTRLLVVAIIAALGATWIELTRRQTLHEFPDAGDSTIVADTLARMSDWWEEQTCGGGRLASLRQRPPMSRRGSPRSPTSMRAAR